VCAQPSLIVSGTNLLKNRQTKGQSHQHFMRKFCAKKNVTKEKLRKALSDKKFLSKMLMKLTQGGLITLLERQS